MIQFFVGNSKSTVRHGKNQGMRQRRIIIAHRLMTNGKKAEQIVQTLAVAAQDRLTRNVMSPLCYPFPDAQSRKFSVGNPEIMQKDTPSILLPLLNSGQIGRTGKSRFKTKAVLSFQMFVQLLQKELSCPDQSRRGGQRRQPLGDHVRIDERTAFRFIHQVFQGKSRLARTIGTGDDMALGLLAHRGIFPNCHRELKRQFRRSS